VEQFDPGLLDIFMPKIDGFETMKLVRKPAIVADCLAAATERSAQPTPDGGDVASRR
jgi:CheY-like chemotaxis protein